MRIDRIRAFQVPLSLREPLRTAAGTHASRTALLVEVTADDGVRGWGENVAPEAGFYTGETAASSMAAMRDLLVPRLAASRDVFPADMFDGWWGVSGWKMAKHALESAMWDVQCRRASVPLATVLGGEVRPVKVGVVVGVHDATSDTVAECVLRAAEGYTRVKVKIEPGRDAEVVRAVRDSLDHSVDLHVDGNGAYARADLDHLIGICDLGVALIEQPFARDDLATHAILAAETNASVCLDESVESLTDLLEAIDAGACDSLNMKPSRVGGFREAMSMLEVCLQRGVPAWVGGMLESGIGRAGALALATHPACTLTPDLSASSRYFAADATPPFVLRNGCLDVPAGPGLGVEPLPEVLAADGTRIETLFDRGDVAR